MSLAEVRLAMMDNFSTIPGVTIPQDPLPREIVDKTIIVFPRAQTSSAQSMARGAVATQTPGSMQVEYHRRIPYEHIGSVMADVTEMIDTIDDLCWKEHAGGKFDGTVLAVREISLEHFGALGWNEWTFGARLLVAFSYLSHHTS